MTNNLKKLEQDLRALAKRCKNISYTKGLLLSFLILGLLSFSEGLTSPEIKSAESSINQARKELNTSISDMKTLFREAKRENDKLLKGSNLELIQLMEQGDQVVKSPWSSWQYGMNYFYSNWRGTYKGKGDKKEKYPYEGIYRRSNDLFLRSISPNSRNYSRYVTRVYDDPLHSATTSTTGLSNASWGIESSEFDQEPVTTLNLLATVRPKEIKKQAPVVNLGTIEGPEEISFSINPPEVEISTPTIREVSFNPVTPVTTTLPSLSTSNIKISSYKNAGDSTTPPIYSSYNNTDNKLSKNSATLGATVSLANTGLTPGATAKSVVQNPAIMYTNQGSALFKTYMEFSPGNGGTITNTTNVVIDSIRGGIGGTAPNNQKFLVGGSRFGTLDNGSGTLANGASATIDLAGVLVVGLQSETNTGTAGNRVLLNSGTITDEVETTHYQNSDGLGGLLVPVTTTYVNGTGSGNRYSDGSLNNDSGAKAQTSLPMTGYSEMGTINIERTPGTGVWDVAAGTWQSRSGGGYVGYKIGLLLSHEDNDSSNNYLLQNAGTISFGGRNSIGIQIEADGSPDTKVQASNSNNIILGGANSYGIKLSSRVANLTGTQKIVNNTGTITIGGGSSAGIAVIEEAQNGTDRNAPNKLIRAYTDKVVNSGTINVNASQSSGMLLKINAPDNIVNEAGGTINVNGHHNIGMRVDKGSVTTDATGDPSAVNKSNIVVKGTANIGMVSNGASKA